MIVGVVKKFGKINTTSMLPSHPACYYAVLYVDRWYNPRPPYVRSLASPSIRVPAEVEKGNQGSDLDDDFRSSVVGRSIRGFWGWSIWTGWGFRYLSGGYSTAHGTPIERASRDRGAEGGRELTFAIAVSHCDGEVGLLWRWLMEDGRGIFWRQKRGI